MVHRGPGRSRRWTPTCARSPTVTSSSSTPSGLGLAGLAARVPDLLAGATDAEGIAFLHVDDTIRQVHGYAKQGAAYEYSGVRGLSVQLAVISTPLSAAVITRARLRRGNVASATGAGRLVAPSHRHRPQRRSEGQSAGVSGLGLLPVRVRGCRDPANAWYSVTTLASAPVDKAIASIGEDDWRPST